MSKKLKTLLGISALFFIGSALCFVLIFTQTEKYVTKITDLSVGVRDQDIRSTQAQKLVTLLKHTTEIQNELKAFIVTESSTVEVIEKLESLGARTGVSVNISSLSADDTGVLGRVRGRVETRGTWSSVLTYMNAVEGLPYRISISNISLKRDPSAEIGKTPTWGMTFSIELLKIK